MNFTRTDPSFFIFNIIACLFLKFYSKKYQIRKLEIFALRRSRKIRWFGFGPFVEFDVFGLGPDYNPTSDKIPELLFTYYTPKKFETSQVRFNRKLDLCRSMHIWLIWSFLAMARSWTDPKDIITITGYNESVTIFITVDMGHGWISSRGIRCCSGWSWCLWSFCTSTMVSHILYMISTVYTVKV